MCRNAKCPSIFWPPTQSILYRQFCTSNIMMHVMIVNWELFNSFKEHFCQPLMHPVGSTLQQGICRHSYVFTSISSPPLSLQVPASVVWGSELTLSNWLIILRSGLSGNTTLYIPCQINTNKSLSSRILTKHGSYIVSLKTFIHSQFQCYMWYDFRIRAGCL